MYFIYQVELYLLNKSLAKKVKLNICKKHIGFVYHLFCDSRNSIEYKIGSKLSGQQKFHIPMPIITVNVTKTLRRILQ